MRKDIKKILSMFDNSYGGDILLSDQYGKSTYLHLTYDEVKTLCKNMKRRDRFQVLGEGWTVTLHKMTRKTAKIDTKNILTAEDVIALLIQAKRPKGNLKRKQEIAINIGIEQTLNDHKLNDQFIEVGKTVKNTPRFDWDEHYLEGLRIHGNQDDAEAHADEMKRKITGRI